MYVCFCIRTLFRNACTYVHMYVCVYVPMFIDRQSRLRSVGFRSGGFPNSLTTYLCKYIVMYLRKKRDNIVFYLKSIIIFIQ